MPKSTRQMMTMTAERRSWVRNVFTRSLSSVPVDRREEHVDQLDEDERGDDPADAVDEDIAPEDGGGTGGSPLDPAQRQRDEGNDDERIENDRREHGGRLVVQFQDIERLELRVGRHEHDRDDGEILG